jgi:cation:H+ antiporter
MSWLELFFGGFLLYLGAGWFVSGASSLALSLRVPQLIIGLTVVAYGTSAPEIIVGIQAAASGHGEVAVANVIGSNISNVGLILGVAALITPANVDGALRRRELPVLLLSTALVPIVLWDGMLTILEAAGLLSIAVAYTAWMVLAARQQSFQKATRNTLAMADATASDEEPSSGDEPTPGPTDEAPRSDSSPTARPSTLRAALTAIGGLLVLLVGGNRFIDGAVTIAQALGLSDRLVGLTIVAVGTSLPELVTSVVAARRGHGDLAVGNVIGSNIFNVLLCLGAAGLAGGIRAPLATIAVDLVALVVMTLLAAIYFRTERKVTRFEGALALACYVAFLAITVARGLRRAGQRFRVVRGPFEAIGSRRKARAHPGVLGQTSCLTKGHARLPETTEALEHVGPRAEERGVPAQERRCRRRRDERIEQRQPGRGILRARDGDRSVQLDHGRRTATTELPVQRRDFRPVGVFGARGQAVTLRNFGLQDVRTTGGRAERRAVRQRGEQLGSSRQACAIPAGAILVEQQDGLAVFVGARRRPSRRRLHQREEAAHLRLRGRKLVKQIAQAEGLFLERWAREIVAGARGIALIVNQVDDLQDRSEPRRQIFASGNFERNVRQRERLFRPHDALRDGRLRGQERARDSLGGQPGDEPERQRDPAFPRQDRVTRDEDEPQDIVGHVFVEPSFERLFDRGERHGVGMQRAHGLPAPFLEAKAPQRVQRAVLRGRHQPGGRFFGHPRDRPLFQGSDERVVRELLGEAHIANDPREDPDDLRVARFVSPDVCEDAFGGRAGHGRITSHAAPQTNAARRRGERADTDPRAARPTPPRDQDGGGPPS